MSGKDNEPTLHGTEQDGERNSAPGTMLVSVLLLIAGLLLTSALLLDSGLARKGQTGKNRTGFSQTLEKAKGLLASAKAKSATRAPSPGPQAKTSKTGKKGILGFSFREKKKSDVHWPHLKLSGFGKAAAGETGFAIINGKRIDEGSGINGATVVKVLDQGVELEYQGATKILAMEATR